MTDSFFEKPMTNKEFNIDREKLKADFDELLEKRMAGLKNMHGTFIGNTDTLKIVDPNASLQSQVEYLSLPKARIPEMAEQYVSLMETEQSDKWCKCIWQIHPDDVNVKDGYCRACDKPRENNRHDSESEDYDHKFMGKRKRRSDENPQCPVHTRAGFILGFFEWLFSDEMAEMHD